MYQSINRSSHSKWGTEASAAHNICSSLSTLSSCLFSTCHFFIHCVHCLPDHHRTMFAVMVAGRLPQVDLQNIDTNKFLVTIPDADSINFLVVFMTGSVAFPPGEWFYCLCLCSTDRISYSWRHCLITMASFAPLTSIQEVNLLLIQIYFQDLEEVSIFLGPIQMPHNHGST